ncbi:cell envelope integrity protein TolA [Candidatus Enterovibrio altilux]|uniref:TolA protein n=1 Tax=Candidatus Enterovibrio altilux TaxID=1927128 RepID=A0A291BBR0_9GAMM|nr:cell envelope integrity protein TolA [Candidatus Enterovibrio luxaltus]ATF10424.1 TolA protein [Candidatus Enterovibrio luxaltus]
MNKKENTGYSGVTIISVLLHAGLLGGLLLGDYFTNVASHLTVNNIEAVVIDSSLVNEQVRKIREQRSETKRQEDNHLHQLKQQTNQLKKQHEQEKKRLHELRTERLAAEKDIRKIETERKRISAARQKEAEEQHQREEATRIAKEKLAAAETERKWQEAEQYKAEEAAAQVKANRQRAEQKRKKAEALKIEEIRKRKLIEQEATRNELFNDLEFESVNRNSARGRFIFNEVSRYGAIYTQMIQQNLLVDSSFFGQQCIVRIRLSSTGFLFDVNEVSGNRTLCRATQTAVLKISSFPVPEDKEIITKLQNIELTVKPK